MVADFGMDGIGEVYRRGPDGQTDDIAIGGEDEDLGVVQVLAQSLHELPRVVGVGGPFQHRAQPPELLVKRAVGIELFTFVTPVGSDAVLADPVHLAGANLNL